MASGGDDKEPEPPTREELEEQLRDVGARLRLAPDDDEDGLLELLGEVEANLMKVDQSPLESMSSAIRPAMAALARKELLGHLNADVKLAVASCISEITRITAPEAPYADDVMKDMFCMIVEAFQHLDEINSPYFARRLSILYTVAEVRSCVMMLDLECDDLIKEMFHHFFKTVSSKHPEVVMSCMVTTMALVIEESEDVQTELASCLLEHVKNEEKESSPLSFELAEKVIGSCREKLKPVFQELLRRTPLDKYSKIVASVLDVKDGSSVDPSGKNTVDDGKLSERTTSDELPQELKQDASCPEQAGAQTNTNSSCGTPVDNGEESAVAKPKNQSDDTLTHSNADMENKRTVSGAADETSEPADSTPDVIKPKRGRPTGLKSLEKAAGAGKNHPSGVALKKTLAPDSAGKLTTQSAKDDVKSSTRKAREGESLKKQQISSKQQKGETLSEEDTAEDLSLKSAKDHVKSSTRKAHEGKSLKRRENISSKQQKGKTPSEEDTAEDLSLKAHEGKSLKRQENISSKQQKGKTLSEEDTAEDLSLKEMVSPKSLTKRSGRTKGQSGENSGVKRKRGQETEETPRTRKNKSLDDISVGAKIKVWWPDDKKFYKGVVHSFDSVSKKHKIAYDDGDIEVLLLRNEKWEFVSEDQDKTPSAVSEMSRGRKGRGDSVQSLKKQNAETPKSDDEDLQKKRGRPKGWRLSNGTSRDGNSATPDRSMGKTASKDAKETPKTRGNLKKEGEKGSNATSSADEMKDDLPKVSSNRTASKPKEAGRKGKDSKDGSKSAEGNAKPGRKPKGAGTSAASDVSVKEKRKEKDDEVAETEQVGSRKASAGKKRRRKA